MAFASATIAGAALPSWPEVAIAAVKPAPIVPVDLAPLIRSGLSRRFKNRECWLRKFWNHYLSEVKEYRAGTPNVEWINFQRWFFETKLSQVVRTVPATKQDRAVKDYAHSLVLALLADFPEVPWRPELAAKLEKCRAWHAAGGISPKDPEAIRIPNQTIA